MTLFWKYQIYSLEKRQSLKVGSPDEVAFRIDWISSQKLEKLSQQILKNNYGKYLLELSQNKI